MTVQKTKTLVGGLLLVLCTVLLPAAFLTVGAAALRPLLALGLALALLSEPELMILDEPTNGLDIEATVEMREVILRLAKEKGVTFLVASHLAAEIEKMCDKVLVLYEGEMLSFDTKEEALRLNPSLEDYFLAKVRDKKGSVVL